MPNYILGKNGKLYYGTTALTDTTTTSVSGLTAAVEFTNAMDVTLGMQKDSIEFNSRANGGWKSKVGGLKDATISFQILWKPGDVSFEAFRDAFLNDTEIPVWALDQAKATTGAQGLAGNFTVSNFSRNEPLDGVMTADVELTPSSFTH